MWKARTKDLLFWITKWFHFGFEALNNFIFKESTFSASLLSFRRLYANERIWFVKKMNSFTFIFIPLFLYYTFTTQIWFDDRLFCALRANRNRKLHSRNDEEFALESILWHVAKINESKEWLSNELNETLWIARKSEMTINFRKCGSKRKFAIKKREKKSDRDWMASTCEIFTMDLRDILRYLA